MQVDPNLNLVKGGGGALLREKMVEVMADKFIVIVDESKLCKGLGPGFPLPVEITPFCHEHTLRLVQYRATTLACVSWRLSSLFSVLGRNRSSFSARVVVSTERAQMLYGWCAT